MKIIYFMNKKKYKTDIYKMIKETMKIKLQLKDIMFKEIIFTKPHHL